MLLFCIFALRKSVRGDRIICCIWGFLHLPYRCFCHCGAARGQEQLVRKTTKGEATFCNRSRNSIMTVICQTRSCCFLRPSALSLLAMRTVRNTTAIALSTLRNHPSVISGTEKWRTYTIILSLKLRYGSCRETSPPAGTSTPSAAFGFRDFPYLLLPVKCASGTFYQPHTPTKHRVVLDCGIHPQRLKETP